MPLKTKVNFDPPRPAWEQLRNVLAVALGSRQSSELRPLSTYEPLAWLLKGDVGDQALRGARRTLYRRLVRDLAREFDRIYSERLLASNGPWDFPDVYIAKERARKCTSRMCWCSLQHLFHLPGASSGSVKAYQAMMELLRDDTLISPAAGPNIA